MNKLSKFERPSPTCATEEEKIDKVQAIRDARVRRYEERTRNSQGTHLVDYHVHTRLQLRTGKLVKRTLVDPEGHSAS